MAASCSPMLAPAAFDHAGLSVDAVFDHVQNAVPLSSLTAAQDVACPGALAGAERHGVGLSRHIRGLVGDARPLRLLITAMAVGPRSKRGRMSARTSPCPANSDQRKEKPPRREGAAAVKLDPLLDR